MNLDICAATDTGRGRSNNEDSIAVDRETGLAVLADGMGGYNAGEVASDLACAVVLQTLGAWLRAAPVDAEPADVAAALSRSVGDANRHILDVATSDPRCAGMGTTLVAAVFRPDGFLIGHVGDSRAYLWRAGRLAQITRDHSLLQEQIDAGLLSPDDALTSSHRNLVTRAIGVEATVETEVHWHALQAGDVVLLCSDGLTDMLSDTAIAARLGGPDGVDAIARRLVDAANEAGGKDNISVILVRAAPGGAAESGSGRSWWPFRH